MANLENLQPGESATILSFSDDATATRMVSMGILPGHLIQIIRKAPFGGAVYVQTDRRQFAIRNQEAACILLK